MHLSRTIVLSLVERGWRGARVAELHEPHMTVVHMAKGRVALPVRELIGLSHPVRLISCWRNLFWLVAWAGLLGLWLSGRLRAVWVDNAKSYRRLAWCCRVLSIDVVLMPQGAGDASRVAV